MSPAFKKNLTLARLKDRATKVDIFARETDGRLAGKQIFTRPALAARASFSRHPMIYYPKELFCTRMAMRHNLLFLHAPLTVGLPEGTCSLLRRAYPHGGTVELASLARDVGSQFAKKHMLAQIMPAARALSPHFSIVLVKGVWGLCPHDYP